MVVLEKGGQDLVHIEVGVVVLLVHLCRSHRLLFGVFAFHIDIHVIHELRSRKSITQNDLY